MIAGLQVKETRPGIAFAIASLLASKASNSFIILLLMVPGAPVQITIEPSQALGFKQDVFEQRLTE